MSAKTILLIGDAGVGKSAWLTRFLSGDFQPEYYPSNTSKYFIRDEATGWKFNVIDVSGQRSFCNIPYEIYSKADYAIIMFDLTNKLSWERIPIWYKSFRAVNSAVPVVLCGSKCDISNRRQVEDDDIAYMLHDSTGPLYGLRYYDISAKSMYQYVEPLKYFNSLPTLKVCS